MLDETLISYFNTDKELFFKKYNEKEEHLIISIELSYGQPTKSPHFSIFSALFWFLHDAALETRTWDVTKTVLKE